MALILNEEQKMLKDSANEFLAMNSPVEKFRTLRDENYKPFDKELWQEIVEMGWTALTIPEQYNGLNFGYVGFGQVLEEMGKCLTKAPLLSSIGLCATALVKSSNEELKNNWIPELMNGTKHMAFAQDEKTYFDPTSIETTASESINGYLINGSKIMVIDGGSADAFIVTANTSDNETALFVVDSKAEGVTIHTETLLDAGTYANIHFNQVSIKNEDRLSDKGKGDELLNYINNTAAICLSAEMLGIVTEAFDQTIAYLQERQQFGKRIGSYQALQHRAAKLFCEIELCKSVVIKALQALDKGDDNIDKLASLAKAKLGETIKLTTNEAIQMHGGIGVTDDVNIGFYFKRARVAQRLFGDYSYHLDRYAKLNAY